MKLSACGARASPGHAQWPRRGGAAARTAPAAGSRAGSPRLRLPATSPPRLRSFQKAERWRLPAISAPAQRRPACRRLPLLSLPSSLKVAKLGLASVRATHRSASPSPGPANASRRPEDSRRGLFPTPLCLKWGRGGVAAPPLNAKRYAESGRLPCAVPAS